MDLFYSYLNYNYLCTIMTTDNKTPLMGQTIDELKETVRQHAKQKAIYHLD